MSAKCSLLLSASLFTSLMLGCGGEDLPEPVAVTGKITMGGNPIDNATVAFSAISGELPPKYRYLTTTTDNNGRYQIDKVYPTEYQVSVIKTAEPPANISGDMVMANTNVSEFAAYGDSSPLRAMVSDSTSAFDFELKAPKKR